MRRSPLFHVTLGTIVVMICGLAGQIGSMQRTSDRTTRASWSCERRSNCERRRSAVYPSSSKETPTWAFDAKDSRLPWRIIVKYDNGRLTDRIVRELLRAGMTHAPAPGADAAEFDLETFKSLPGLGVLDFSDQFEAKDALAELRASPHVEYAELDGLWHVDRAATRPFYAAPNDARYAEQWGLENTGQPVNGHPAGTPGVDIDAPNAWLAGHGSEDVVVAVIDSGVDYTHEDLTANMWVNEGEIPGNGIDDDNNGVVDDVYGYNAIDNSGDPDDDAGHGTHVAGIIGAVGDNGTGVTGVNWTTRIMALKFLGAGGGGTTSDAIACIDYMLKMKERGVNVRVANCSWGSMMESQALEDAIDRAVGQGILFVCASGNDGVNTDRVPHYPSCYKTDGIISVAALAPSERLASFSNYGHDSVDVAAPGVDILSTMPDESYNYASGTSMASPFVAGVAALVASTDPKMPYKKIRERVLGGAEGVPGFDDMLVTGGRLSGSGALR